MYATTWPRQELRGRRSVSITRSVASTQVHADTIRPDNGLASCPLNDDDEEECRKTPPQSPLPVGRRSGPGLSEAALRSLPGSTRNHAYLAWPRSCRIRLSIDRSSKSFGSRTLKPLAPPTCRARHYSPFVSLFLMQQFEGLPKFIANLVGRAKEDLEPGDLSGALRRAEIVRAVSILELLRTLRSDDDISKRCAANAGFPLPHPDRRPEQTRGSGPSVADIRQQRLQPICVCSPGRLKRPRAQVPKGIESESSTDLIFVRTPHLGDVFLS